MPDFLHKRGAIEKQVGELSSVEVPLDNDFTLASITTGIFSKNLRGLTNSGLPVVMNKELKDVLADSALGDLHAKYLEARNYIEFMIFDLIREAHSTKGNDWNSKTEQK